MGMRRVLYFLLAGVLLLGSMDTFGQMNRRNIKRNNKRISNYRGRKSWFSKEKRYNAIGINISSLNYYGDLSPQPKRISTDIKFTRPAFGLSFTHRFGPRYSITAMLQYGTLKGSDAESAKRADLENGVFRSDRNLSFRNRIKELSVVATFDLFENNSTYISRVKWTPYAFIGFGIFTNNPKAKVPEYHVDGVTKFGNAGDWVALQPLHTEGKKYSKIQPNIPFGIGARYRFNEVIDFAVEFGFRYTFTDYIDDVSRDYKDLNTFTGGNADLARAMSYRSGELPQYNPANAANYSTNGGPLVNVNGYWLVPGRIGVPGDMRGRSGNHDYYMVTTLKATYIIGKTFHRAKFR